MILYSQLTIRYIHLIIPERSLLAYEMAMILLNCPQQSKEDLWDSKTPILHSRAASHHTTFIATAAFA